MAELAPVYLIHGDDRVKASAAIARMKAHFDADSIEQYIAGAKPGVEEIVAGAGMLGLFASRRLIVVTGVDAWGAADLDVVIDYVKDPSPDIVLLLVAGKLKANSRLLKSVPKAQVVACAGPGNEKDMAVWVERRFAELGASVSAATARAMVAVAGIDSLDRIAADIDRIVTYAGTDPIDTAMIERLTTPGTEQKVWALTDAWASHDAKTLLGMAHQLIDQREHPARLAQLVASHIRRVHHATAELAAGASEAGVRQSLEAAGTNAWAARKVIEQARRLGSGPAALRRADAALARAVQLEAELKGASSLASQHGETVLERGLAELV